MKGAKIMKVAVLPIKLPDNYIENNYIGSWKGLFVGLDKGWLSIKAAITIAKKIASKKQNPSEKEIEVLFLDYLEENNAKSLISQLSLDQGEDEAIEEWCYIFLKWLHEFTDSSESLSNLIDYIYAELGYPEEIAHLVSYMPLESFDKEHPLKQSNFEQYLREKIEKYLKDKDFKYNS